MSNDTRDTIIGMMPDYLKFFLKKRRVLTKYVDNVHLCCKQKIHKRFPDGFKEEWNERLKERLHSIYSSKNILLSSFDWERSMEGFDFWYNLDTDFKIFLKNREEAMKWEKE